LGKAKIYLRYITVGATQNHKLSELGTEKKRLRAEIEQISNASDIQTDFEKTIKEILGGMDQFEEIFDEEVTSSEKKAFIRRYVGAVKIIPQEKKAMVGWYQLPKPESPVCGIAGARYEPTSSEL